MQQQNAIRLVLIALVLAFSFPAIVAAHPGRTASDGCHYCRTRCDYWGVTWNVRHCHGGSVVLPPPPPTIKSTPKPKPPYTPQSTATPTPSLEPEVRGESFEPSPTPTQLTASDSETNGGDVILGLLTLGALLGGTVWLIKKAWNKFRGEITTNE